MWKNDHPVEKGRGSRTLDPHSTMFWGAVGAASTASTIGGAAAFLAWQSTEHARAACADEFALQNADDAAPEYSLARQLVRFVRAYVQYRRLCRLVGRRLDIPYDRAADLLEEARRHKWLEAEKAGRDIWSERNPHDPEAAAFGDWFTRHYDSWRAHNRPRWA